MGKEYHSGNRCRYLLKVHLILVIKYRKKLLTGSMDDDIKQVLFDISKESDFSIEMMETDKDHVHMLLDYPPNLSLSSIVNRLKSMSTNRIWKRRAIELKKQFWKENTFWSDGYFCCSTGDACTETIRQYIEEQG
jgi:putative transposase